MKRKLLTSWPVFFIFIFFVFGRVFSYLKSSVPLGYDPGLYLQLFKKFSFWPLASWREMPIWMQEMFQPGIPVVGRILTLFFSPEKIIIPLIVLFEMLLFWSVYLLAKKLWGKKTALWTAFIFACSAIQFRFYWYYYLKNIAALSFLLFTIYYLPTGPLRRIEASKAGLRSKSYLAILFSVLVFYFHQQTAAFLFGFLLLMLFFQKKQRKYYGTVLLITLALAAFYYLPTFNQSFKHLIRPVIYGFLPKPAGGTLGTPSGSFYGLKQALLLMLPYLPFGAWGFWLLRKQKRELVITVPFLMALMIVLFGFFLSRRFIPFLDLFLIFFAGYGVVNFSPPRKTILAGAYLGLLIIFISVFIQKTGKPLIYEDELREIKMLSQTEPEAYVLVTDEAYMPWVYGWSERKPIAPGYGEYDIYWTIPEWHKFWESGDRKVEHDLLLKLPKPLYIYHGDMGSRIPTDFSGECFERINWRTSKFICEN